MYIRELSEKNSIGAIKPMHSITEHSRRDSQNTHLGTG